MHFSVNHPLVPNDSPQDTAAQINLIATIDQIQSRLSATEDILRRFQPRMIGAYDLSGSPFTYNFLAEDAGSWPGTGTATTNTPYMGKDVSNASAGKVTVVYGTHNNQVATIGGTPLQPPFGTPIPVLTLGISDTVVYIEVDVDFDVTGAITSYTGTTITSGTSMPSSSLSFNPDGSGTGSFYQDLFGVTVNPPSGGGNYSVTIGQNIFSSITFVVCGNGFSYNDV